jgi:hypothetical protein
MGTVVAGVVKAPTAGFSNPDFENVATEGNCSSPPIPEGSYQLRWRPGNPILSGFRTEFPVDSVGPYVFWYIYETRKYELTYVAAD